LPAPEENIPNRLSMQMRTYGCETQQSADVFPLLEKLKGRVPLD
jgi:hypothetical protein